MVRPTLTLLAIAATIVLGTPPQSAAAYPIDCAILLCLAGGFPASIPCTEARNEVIRRITPWPIEPPLQIWRCPMHAAFVPSLTSLPSSSIQVSFDRNRPTAPSDSAEKPAIPSDYDPVIEGYLASIKVYQMTYSRSYSSASSNCTVFGFLQVGYYNVSGTFLWRHAQSGDWPVWMFDPTYTGCPGAWFRGIGIEWKDFGGRKGTEVVRY